MRYLTIMMISVLFICAHSLNEYHLQHTFAEIPELLQSTSLGRAINNFIEVASLMSQFNYNKLFDAIEELQASLKSSKEEENLSFDNDYNDYISDSNFFKNQIVQYTNEIATHNTDLRNLNFMLEIYTDTLAKKRVDLEKTTLSRDELIVNMKKEEEIYLAQLKDFNTVLTTLDAAIDLIKQIKEDDEFLQLNHEQFFVAGKDLEQSFKQFNHQRIFFEPFVEALIEMASEKLADQEMVHRVLRMMQELQSTLNAGKLTLQNQYELSRKANQAVLDGLNNKIRMLEKAVIPKLLENIETTNGQIKTKKGLLFDATVNLADAQDNLEQTEKRWVQRQIEHKDLIDEFNKELSIIETGILTLEKNGIRRQ